ncbi:MAG TPA: heavy metal-responsive transcriptional regulator [Leptolyngbyaceae cyanobacterium]
MLAQEPLKLIGSVARESGVPIKTIRYYEELGLLKPSDRTEGKYRLFDSDVLNRLRFIKRAQKLGLTLAEIKEFLNIHDRGDLPCDRVKVKLQNQLQAIDEQIQQLLMLKLQLEGLLSDSETINQTIEETICPIIESA